MNKCIRNLIQCILRATNETCPLVTLGRVLELFKFSDLYGSDTSDGGFEDCDIVQSCEVDTNILHALVSSFSELLQPSRCRQEECRATNVQVFRDVPDLRPKFPYENFNSNCHKNVTKVSFRTTFPYFTEETLFLLFCNGKTFYLNPPLNLLEGVYSTSFHIFHL